MWRNLFVQADTTFTRTTNTGALLAVIHIGMLLSSWDANEELPINLDAVNKRILEIFGVSMQQEPNVQEARNKIMAIIEQIQNRKTIQ